MPGKTGKTWLLGLALASLLSACASHGPIQEARSEFRAGDAEAALTTLDKAEVERRDRLLLHLDRALIAQSLGRFEESTTEFERAYRLIEKLDVISVSEQGSALVTSDRATSYRGEYSERLWLHTHQMLNYLLLAEPQSAAVEARRALTLFDTHGDILDADNVTRLLMAMSFEAAGQYDSASVEYRRMLDDGVNDPGVLAAAWRNARRFGRLEQAADIADRLASAGLSPPALDSGELVVIEANGFISPKLPGDLFVAADLRISFPYYPTSWRVPLASSQTFEANGSLATSTTLDLTELSRRSLEARGKRLATRQVARIATKQSLRFAVERNVANSAGEAAGEVAGTLANLLFLVLEQADTRSWESLPAELAIGRLALPPGQHDIAWPATSGNLATELLLSDVDIRRARRTFRLIRNGRLVGNPSG